MKQVELARRLGISKSYLSMILSGKRKASLDIVDKLHSLGIVNFEANLSLARRRSTAELLPLSQI